MKHLYLKHLYFLFVLCILNTALCLILSGCSSRPRTNETEFTVTFDGKPLSGASVSLIPKDANGTPAFGITDDAGKCRTQTLLGRAGGGTSEGQYAAVVSKPEERPTGRKTINPDTGISGEITENVETVPEVYVNAGTTPFIIEVKPGKNTFTLGLESAKKKQ